MAQSALILTRDYDLPRAIVWDALVEPSLVEGWLDPDHDLLSEGQVSELDSLSVLAVSTAYFGALEFQLDELPEGTRGASTRLTLTVRQELNEAFAASAEASWQIRLDQLEQLLRGNPVDWSHWERDYRAAWSNYHDAALRHAR